MLMDETKRCNIFRFARFKCEHRVRYVLDGETYAFADGLDLTFVLRQDLTTMLQRQTQ